MSKTKPVQEQPTTTVNVKLPVGVDSMDSMLEQILQHEFDSFQIRKNKMKLILRLLEPAVVTEFRKIRK